MSDDEMSRVFDEFFSPSSAPDKEELDTADGHQHYFPIHIGDPSGIVGLPAAEFISSVLAGDIGSAEVLLAASRKFIEGNVGCEFKINLWDINSGFVVFTGRLVETPICSMSNCSFGGIFVFSYLDIFAKLLERELSDGNFYFSGKLQGDVDITNDDVRVVESFEIESLHFIDKAGNRQQLLPI